MCASVCVCLCGAIGPRLDHMSRISPYRYVSVCVRLTDCPLKSYSFSILVPEDCGAIRANHPKNPMRVLCVLALAAVAFARDTYLLDYGWKFELQAPVMCPAEVDVWPYDLTGMKCSGAYQSIYQINSEEECKNACCKWNWCELYQVRRGWRRRRGCLAFRGMSPLWRLGGARCPLSF